MISVDKVVSFLKEADRIKDGRWVYTHVNFYSSYPIIIERLEKEPNAEGDNSIVDLKFSVCHDEALFTRDDYRALLGDRYEFVVSYSGVEGRAGYKITEFTAYGVTTCNPKMENHSSITDRVHACFGIVGKGLGLDMTHEISAFR